MTPFAGWEMPVEFSGIAAEHTAVRTRAGLFDVSHMGELEIAGRNALALVQEVSCNDASALSVGQAHYSALLTPRGTFLDDVVVYRLAGSHFLMVVNAANTAKDYAWLTERARALGDAAVVDSSSRYALLSIQGPAARDVLQPVCSVDVSTLRYYWFTYGEVSSARALISRTGYTGEDGFEIFVPPAMATRVWHALTAEGRKVDLLPCALGARDTLRLEAGMRLYGNDIDESTTPLEAGLEWIVAWNKSFIGKDALVAQKEQGVTRSLVGFELTGPGIARQGHHVMAASTGSPVGQVTSGTQTPFLKKSIGLAYVTVDNTGTDTPIAIDIRGRLTPARIVPLPFYRRPRG